MEWAGGQTLTDVSSAAREVLGQSREQLDEPVFVAGVGALTDGPRVGRQRSDAGELGGAAERVGVRVADVDQLREQLA